MEREQFILPEHLNSLLFLDCVRIAYSFFSVFFTLIIVCLYLFLNIFLATCVFLVKEGFNSDDLQFNEYQQDEELPLLIYDYFSLFFVMKAYNVWCPILYQSNMKQFIEDNSGI